MIGGLEVVLRYYGSGEVKINVTYTVVRVLISSYKSINKSKLWTNSVDM